MKAYEVDFLLSNFQGSASMFESVYAADTWYAGMADAALARGIVIQYCLASATDVLQALSLPAVVQARASGDYVNKAANPGALGGSSLLMGALAVAPSKDTLWTASPQPGTMSDTEHDGLSYTTQPHVALDAVLATLSLGPVGISDGLGQADARLISQAFRCANDSTLLRPSRPLSWVDSVLLNKTYGRAWVDVRAAHAAVPGARAGAPAAPPHVSYSVLAWATAADATLGAADLFPAPPPDATLAVRAHDVLAAPAGCVAGAPAVPACVTMLDAGAPLVIPALGTNLSALALYSLHAPLPNGAYFLGELAKFVHVAPQRFSYVSAGGAGAAGVAVGVLGASGEVVALAAVDAGGVVRTATARVGASGAVDVEL